VPLRLLPAVCLLVLLGACASQESSGSHVVLLPKEGCAKKEEQQKDPKKHVHVWEEWTWHTAEDWSSGIPMTKIVTVYRCRDCGEIRDETQRRTK
jgi:hypothetical protein